LRLVSALAFFIILFAAGAAFAADPLRVEITGLQEQQGRLVVTVGVTGPDGKPLSGLNTANFRAILDGQPISVSNVQTSNTARSAASIVLVVDVSGSMAGEPMNQAKRALQEFLRGLDPGDQVALMAFDVKVTLIQDFTSDRALLNAAIGRLTPQGDTALYDGVIEATAKAAQGPGARKLVVLLSDGLATTGLDKRPQSIDAARNSGAGFVAVGLGSAIDRAYLTELTTASGGRFLDAPTPASLRQYYVDLAVAIRSQHTLVLQVPPGKDRSVTAQLMVEANTRTASGQVTREIPPLAGAAPPSFDLLIQGIAPGQRATTPLSVEVKPVDETVKLTSVEYLLDGKAIHRATAPPFIYELDPAAIEAGTHSLKVIAADERGRQSDTQLPFIAEIPVAPAESPLRVPTEVLILAGAVAALGGAIYVIYWRRESRPASVVTRMRPWASRVVEAPAGPVEGWPEQPPPPPLPPSDVFLGRVVVMEEEAVRNGALDAIKEYPIGSAPLTVGTGPACEIRLEDSEGRIAAEEARLWVQKGHLVYHKLTTLSAMATEGVTSGWQILENDEEITLGPYRIHFRAETVVEPEMEQPEAAIIPSDDTSFFRDYWTRVPEDPPLSASSTEWPSQSGSLPPSPEST
jgi:VWFA-related protein